MVKEVELESTATKTMTIMTKTRVEEGPLETEEAETTLMLKATRAETTSCKESEGKPTLEKSSLAQRDKPCQELARREAGLPVLAGVDPITPEARAHPEGARAHLEEARAHLEGVRASPEEVTRKQKEATESQGTNRTREVMMKRVPLSKELAGRVLRPDGEVRMLSSLKRRERPCLRLEAREATREVPPPTDSPTQTPALRLTAEVESGRARTPRTLRRVGQLPDEEPEALVSLLIYEFVLTNLDFL